ncbi:MAG: hypothetical protein C0459_12810 [Chitinophaga sp.]|jgi:hypothetical protein|nr:hypothetical protein [Chitinophaga sp.]
MKEIIFIFLSAITVTSCNNINSPNTILKKADIDTTILDISKLGSDTNNSLVNKVDTFNYINIPYWDSTMGRFDSAYIDTFTVDGNQFRFINPYGDTIPKLDKLVYLEKRVYGKWIYTGLALGTMNHVYDFHHSRDVNGDGYIDITQDLKWDQIVYFYNPQTHTYPSNSSWHIDSDDYINSNWVLIDTSKKIFCDFFEGKGRCGSIHSTLYTFNGTVKKNLYDLELYNCSTEDGNLITKLVLSELVERKYYDHHLMFEKDSIISSKDIPLKKPIDTDKEYDEKIGYFDYVNFWKQRYKELIK